jgi:hypothetical protein
MTTVTVTVAAGDRSWTSTRGPFSGSSVGSTTDDATIPGEDEKLERGAKKLERTNELEARVRLL